MRNRKVHISEFYTMLLLVIDTGVNLSQDECSFVSLRDVERAMTVFEYFFDKNATFGPAIDQKFAEEAEVMERV